ncbi:MAG: TolC family protein, partial [Solimonas sp.]
MKPFRPWLAGLLGVCLASAAHAADPPPARPLSLPELTAIALRNNPDTRVAWAAVTQSQAAERIARAGWWPSVAATYSG